MLITKRTPNMIIQQTSTLNATNAVLVNSNVQQQNQFSSVITDITNIRNALNGNITFNDNMSGVFVTFTTSTANASNSVTHTLGSIPIGFIVTNINVGGVVYAPSTLNWTATQIQLYCSAANATITVFLLAGG